MTLRQLFQTCLLLAAALAPLSCSETSRHARLEPSSGVSYSPEGEPEGLHQYRLWSPKLGQGAQPEGEAAFRNLKALGFTTIVSVDGAKPDVERAARHGLRYIHIPIGYDGVTAEQQVRIVKAVQVAGGPVYFHCHHGKHRGPAAAMVARISLEGITHEEAVECLRLSGTSPEYEGLYRDVRTCKAPTAAALAKVSADLPSVVLPEGLRAMMVEIDERWSILKQAREADWKSPPRHPDVAPAHEARMTWELYREIARLDEAKAHGAEFLSLNAEAEGYATALEEAIRKGDRDAAEAAYKAGSKSCNSCHSGFRN